MPQDIVIELADDVICVLENMAQRRGVSLSDLAKEIIEAAPAEAKDDESSA